MKIAKQNEGKRLSDLCRDSLAEILSYFDSPRDWRSFFRVCRQLYVDLTESGETIWGMKYIRFDIGPSDMFSQTWDNKIIPRLKDVTFRGGYVSPFQVLNPIVSSPDASIPQIYVTSIPKMDRDANAKFWGLSNPTPIEHLQMDALFLSQPELDEFVACANKQKSLSGLFVNDHTDDDDNISTQMTTFVAQSKTLRTYGPRMRNFKPSMVDSVVALIRGSPSTLRRIKVFPTLDPERSELPADVVANSLLKVIAAGGNSRRCVSIIVMDCMHQWYMRNMPDTLLKRMKDEGETTNLYDLREKERKKSENSIV